ncbi:ABC transporter permease [Pontibacillus yanchengensis]|uniref:Bacitracin ABC transporter permease n=1 Tax=Pontibacillus yanchengensis Y32 TaxID=1385514 RepID=A0A0A2TAR8_9BACI|nr:ABC transporter permease [Pontibacillus yanchengensis]KGP72882.1 bacitracin ABC transporter permease [Pontibacillus yanchengensis Y32]
MHQLRQIIWVEWVKSRKSKVVWITFFAFTMLPLMGGFFMFVLKHPEFAEQAGLLGAKAQLAGSADWPSYFMMLSQGIGIGGLFIFGFFTSWIFGREYTDRTVKDLLALPFPRTYVAIAKFIIVLLWSVLVTLWVACIGFLIGWMIGLPEWSTEVLQHGLFVLSITSVLTILLSTPVALFACLGRGYLAPLGFVIITMILSQIIAAIGYGSYFPWAIPALFSNVNGGGNILEVASVIVLLLTSSIGFIGTLGYWRYADQN